MAPRKRISRILRKSSSPEIPVIEARQKQPMDGFDRGYVTAIVADNFGNGFSNFFPLHTAQTGQSAWRCGVASEYIDESGKYLAAIGASHELLFYHAIAILHSPAYRTENQGALRQDWPRIPLPAHVAALKASAQLGKEIAALLDIHQSERR